MAKKSTIYETMAVAISHELNDNENWHIGLATGDTTIQILSRVPIVGMALAQLTHAPNSTMGVVNFKMNPVISEIPTTMESEFGTALYYWRCESHDRLIHPKGETALGFCSAAQVDKYGNCNTVCIGDYYKPKIWLVGPINVPSRLTNDGREIIVVDHQKRNFVDKVDYISGPGYLDGPGAREKAGLFRGGPCMILTDKCIFGFDPETKLVKLRALHPGVTLEEVIENTGFIHDWVPRDVPETQAPTDEEVRLIREVIDPRGVLIPR